MGTMFSLIKVDVSKAIRFIMTGFHMWNPIYTQTYTACPFGLVLTFYSPFWRICLSSARGCPALPKEPWQSALPTLLSVSDYESGLRSKHKWLSAFIKPCLCLECSQRLSDAIRLQIPAGSTPGHQTRGPATPKAQRSPPKPPQHCQELLQPLLSSWLPQGRKVSGRTGDGLKTGGRTWQPSKAGLQKRKRNKKRARRQRGNLCRGFAVPEARGFVSLSERATEGLGHRWAQVGAATGCTHGEGAAHPQPEEHGTLKKSAECIIPILDALYSAAQKQKEMESTV